MLCLGSCCAWGRVVLRSCCVWGHVILGVVLCLGSCCAWGRVVFGVVLCLGSCCVWGHVILGVCVVFGVVLCMVKLNQGAQQSCEVFICPPFHLIMPHSPSGQPVEIGVAYTYIYTDTHTQNGKWIFKSIALCWEKFIKILEPLVLSDLMDHLWNTDVIYF